MTLPLHERWPGLCACEAGAQLFHMHKYGYLKLAQVVPTAVCSWSPTKGLGEALFPQKCGVAARLEVPSLQLLLLWSHFFLVTRAQALAASVRSSWSYLKLAGTEDLGRAQGHFQLWSRRTWSGAALSEESQGNKSEIGPEA